MKKLFLTIAVISAFVLNIGSASAAIVNYNGSNIDMGEVTVGQSGTIGATGLGGLIINTISGVLPANSLITFTYNFSGNLLSGLVGSGGEYSYNLGGTNYYGNTFSLSPMNTSVSYATQNGVSSSPLILASSQIDFGANSASTVIGNNSAGLAEFASIFSGLVIGGNAGLSIAYSVSAVPLPAALPLFGAGLSALFGYGAYKRRKAA